MIVLENNILKVELNLKGAELKSIFNKRNNQEYIWPGTTGSFKKSAPNLFPFIGCIKNDEIDYPYRGERVTLPMTKHGFARDLDFVLIEHSEDTAIFELTPNEYTKERYPYNFSFKVIYKLENDKLAHKYLVKNLDEENMFYHVGGHTAFNLNFNDDSNLENYYLDFEKEVVKKFILDPENKKFISSDYEPYILERTTLSKELFKNDALVLLDLTKNRISLNHKKSDMSIEFEFINLPVLTLWTSLDESNFICLEPWAGITDFTKNSTKVEDKMFIQTLTPNEEREYIQIITVK